MCNGEGHQRVLFSSVPRRVASTAKEQREGTVGSVLGLFREDDGSKVPSEENSIRGAWWWEGPGYGPLACFQHERGKRLYLPWPTGNNGVMGLSGQDELVEIRELRGLLG